MAVSNVVNQVMVDFVHPDFVKEFYYKDNHFNFPKVRMLILPLTRTTFGGSLVFGEGKHWAKQRKILNQVFNFDLVLGIIPKMCEVCDNSFSQLVSQSPRV